MGEPIFNCYVFVKSTDTEIAQLTKQINGVISLLYWKDQPATIKKEEINAIKEFTHNYQDIIVEKMHAEPQSEETDITYLMDGQILLIKNRTMKLNLPSLGLTIVAKLPEEKLEEVGIFRNKRLFGNKEVLFLNSSQD